MKKILTPTILAAFVTLFSLNTLAGNITLEDAKEIDKVQTLISEENNNIQKIYLKNPEMFTTSKRSDSDLEMESMILEKFKDLYFSKKDTFSKEYYDKMMNGYFIDALKSGHRNLADAILFNSGADIKMDFMSDSPKNNPLMAISTSFSYDGGDIEYFMKLVQLGADYTYSTKQNNVPLMSLAAAVNNYKIVLYLSMKGESPMHLDGFDYYPMDYAVKNDATQTMIMLTSIINEYKKQIEAKNATN